MNPNIQDLIAKVLSGAISLQDFYAVTEQMGLRQGEAQTLLSNAQAQTQGIDPALGQYSAEPVSDAQSIMPPQTATVPARTPQQMSIMDKMRTSPAAQAIAAAREKLMPNTGGASAGSMVGSAQASTQPMSQPTQSEATTSQPYQVQQFVESGSPYLGNPTPQQASPSPAQQAVRAARQTISQPQTPVPLRRDEVLGQNGGEPQQGPSTLARLIRGDFSEGSDQRVMQAMQRQREESGIEPGKAEGGAATGKTTSGKDAALHKALEIIHMMLSRH